MRAGSDAQWALVQAAAEALAGTLDRTHFCFFSEVSEAAMQQAESVLTQLQRDVPASLCTIMQQAAPAHTAPNNYKTGAAAAALQVHLLLMNSMVYVTCSQVLRDTYACLRQCLDGTCQCCFVAD